MEEIEISPSGSPILVNNHEEVVRIALQDISYDLFFRNFMQPNRAVVIEGVASDWECFRRWFDRSAEPPKLDVAYLRDTLPNVPVPVADCGKQHYNSHEKLEQNLHEFLQRWEGDETTERNRYYLKDWHLRREQPDYGFYRTPDLFASDWLNEYLTEKGTDDYRFVYIGPKGTWTAFHADVFGSYSWSVNIFGRKRWYLLPPGEERKLRDRLGNLPFSVTEQSLRQACARYFCIEQAPGEAIFVPTGWYHQVLNVEDAISVNHNWFNGCNIRTVWCNLQDALHDVRREIDDCREMENFDEHCQLMLKASFGMDYADFLTIVLYICAKRIACLMEGKITEHFDKYVLGRNHLVFDLNAIKKLLDEMIEKNYLTSFPDLQELVVNCFQQIQKADFKLGVW